MAHEQKLIHQANLIAAQFAAYPRERAVLAVAQHIRRFWDPRIRRRLLALPQEALDPLVREALDGLRDEAAAAQRAALPPP